MGKKGKSGKNFSALQNGEIRELQIGGGFRDYKSEQEGLQIEAVLGISNWGKEISNRGRDCKSRQQGFQIGARITNLCRTASVCKLLVQLASINVFCSI